MSAAANEARAAFVAPTNYSDRMMTLADVFCPISVSRWPNMTEVVAKHAAGTGIGSEMVAKSEQVPQGLKHFGHNRERDKHESQ